MSSNLWHYCREAIVSLWYNCRGQQFRGAIISWYTGIWLKALYIMPKLLLSPTFMSFILCNGLRSFYSRSMPYFISHFGQTPCHGWHNDVARHFWIGWEHRKKPSIKKYNGSFNGMLFCIKWSQQYFYR